MMAVGLSSSEIRSALETFDTQPAERDIFVTCINSPKSVTLSGSSKQLDELKSLLEKNGTFARRLNVPVAYHSKHMNAIASEYELMITNVLKSDYELKSEELPRPILISSVTGTEPPLTELRKPRYWVDNLICPVRFSEALSLLYAIPEDHIAGKLGGVESLPSIVHDWVEIGPHSTLQSAVKSILQSVNKSKEVAYSFCLARRVSAIDTLLNTVGHLYCRGYQIDLDAVNRTDIEQRRVLTDLPGYEFDHSKSYWTENRVSRGLRFRSNPRLDLVGTRVSDTHDGFAVWKNTIRVFEMPWIEDHQIDGIVLYPGAGMLVMALEAAKQLSPDTEKVSGFRIRDTQFKNPLRVPSNEDGVEIQILLHSIPTQTDSPGAVWAFEICSLLQDKRVFNCHGSVEAEYDDKADVVSSISRSLRHALTSRNTFEERQATCHKTADRKAVYNAMQQAGLNYGPSFQLLDDLASNEDGEAIGSITPYFWMAEGDSNHPQPHVIHPATLDCVFQLGFVPMANGGVEALPTMVVSGIQDIWLSSSGLSSPTASSLDVCSKSMLKGNKLEMSVNAVSTLGSPCISISGIEATVVAQKPNASSSIPLCYHVAWKPDPEATDQNTVRAFCETNRPPPSPSLRTTFQNLGALMILDMTRALQHLSMRGVKELPAHLQNYALWMKRQLDRFMDGSLPNTVPEWKDVLDDADRQNDLRLWANAQASWVRLYSSTGQNLPAIFDGELDPLSWLFSTGHAQNFYKDAIELLDCRGPVLSFLGLLVHKVPDMKIIEVGAGTGIFTSWVMEAMTGHRHGSDIGPMCASYDYTDISWSFFGDAQHKYQDYGARIQFKTLDIEKTPADQGFEHGSYDLVIAGNVGTVEDLLRTNELMQHLLGPACDPQHRGYDEECAIVAKAVRYSTSVLMARFLISCSGGKLLLVEVTKIDRLGSPFIFGLLPGWWLGTKFFESMKILI